MNLKVLLQLIGRNIILILAGAFLCAAATAYLTSKQKQDFTSKALVSTGIISSVNLQNAAGGKKVDRDYAQNEIENLIALATAHETLEALSSQLLAQLIQLPHAQSKWISEQEFDFLHQEVFTTELLSLRDSSFEACLQNVIAQRDANSNNTVQGIIYSDEPYFGIEFFQKQLQVYRKGNSDLLQFSYSCNDRQLARQTLNTLLEIFQNKHNDLKASQSSEVAGYFKNATQSSAQKLKDKEAALLQFRVQHKIINYNEQTRTIAIRKEDLDELKFKENMNLEAAKSSRTRIEQEMDSNKQLSQINQGLLSMREELNKVAMQLNKIDIEEHNQAGNKDLVQRQALEEQQAALTNNMQNYVHERYALEQSPAGVQKKKLLDEWLTTIINEEQNKAKLSVIDQRQQEFADIYGQYAPWGSQLKELQRSIDLAENEYLENLHSYNQALLHKQNNLMSSKLELIDAPFLPILSPNYKPILFTIFAFFAGAALVFVGLIIRLFMDERMQTPQIAEQKTNLTVASVLPQMMGKNTEQKEASKEQAFALLLQQIKVETLQKDHHPKLILICSTRPEEGKTWIGAQIATALRAEHSRVLYLQPVEGGVLPNIKGKDNKAYELSNQMLDADHINDLDTFGAIDTLIEAYNYVILEVPSLLSGKYPLALLRQFDLSLLVCNANRSWEAADQQALKTLTRATRHPIRLVLNGVQMNVMRDFMGQLSKSPNMAFRAPAKKAIYD